MIKSISETRKYGKYELFLILFLKLEYFMYKHQKWVNIEILHLQDLYQ
jgi:hypothetical protein